MTSRKADRQPHPCAGLSKRAHEVFEQIAIGNDLAGHHPRILETLVSRGLVERRAEQMPGPFPGTTMTVNRYAVPLIDVPQIVKKIVGDLARAELYPAGAPDGVADQVKDASAEMLDKHPLYPGLDLA